MNFDAAFKDGEATSGVILRDHRGKTLGVWSDMNFAPDAFTAEAQAALLAIKTVVTQQIPKIIFEGDASNVIGALLGQSDKVEWRGEAIINKGKELLRNLNL